VLSPPGLPAAHWAAIALTAITVLTDPEHHMTSTAAANPLPQNHFARKHHARRRRGLDNGSRSWQVRTSLLRGDLLRVARPGPCRCKRRGPNTPPAFQTKLHLSAQRG
jgi:hypothetical protein